MMVEVEKEPSAFVASLSPSPLCYAIDLSHVLYTSSPNPLWQRQGGGGRSGVYRYSGWAAFQAARCSYNCHLTIASTSGLRDAVSSQLALSDSHWQQQQQTGHMLVRTGNKKELCKETQMKGFAWIELVKEQSTHAIDMWKYHHMLDIRFNFWIRN